MKISTIGGNVAENSGGLRGLKYGVTRNYVMGLEVVLPNGERYMLNATLVDTSLRAGTDVNEEGQFKGAGHDGKDLTEIGMGTGGAMLVGGLIGGGKGMLIGGTIGATATVAHWLSKHRSAMLPAGTELVMELSRPMALRALAASSSSPQTTRSDSRSISCLIPKRTTA